MPFQPGQSGNPNGRPALVRDFRQRCQNFMAKSGWKALEEMADDPTSPHRYRSLELIAAYAHGRPTQPIAGDADSDMPPIRVTVTFDHNSADEDSEPTTT